MGQVEKAAFGFLIGPFVHMEMFWENSCILNQRDHSHIEAAFSSYILTRKVSDW
jgi:hypothetical protein